MTDRWLVAPLRVEALPVTQTTRDKTAWREITLRAAEIGGAVEDNPLFLNDPVRHDPLTGKMRPPTGVHLHWRLPAALRRAIEP